jgi:hypothetical protein
MVKVTGVIPVYVDDRLANRTGLPQTMPPTRCDAKLKSAVTSRARKWGKDNAALVLPSYRHAAKGLWGMLFGAADADVDLESFDMTWDAKGVIRCRFVWNVHAPEVDLERLKDNVAGGISDGWGESVEQAERFGELCEVGEDGLWARATAARKKDLNTNEHGRYAILLTVVGAKFSFTNA